MYRCCAAHLRVFALCLSLLIFLLKMKMKHFKKKKKAPINGVKSRSMVRLKLKRAAPSLSAPHCYSWNSGNKFRKSTVVISMLLSFHSLQFYKISWNRTLDPILLCDSSMVCMVYLSYMRIVQHNFPIDNAHDSFHSISTSIFTRQKKNISNHQ